MYEYAHFPCPLPKHFLYNYHYWHSSGYLVLSRGSIIYFSLVTNKVEYLCMSLVDLHMSSSVTCLNILPTFKFFFTWKVESELSSVCLLSKYPHWLGLELEIQSTSAPWVAGTDSMSHHHWLQGADFSSQSRASDQGAQIWDISIINWCLNFYIKHLFSHF